MQLVPTCRDRALKFCTAAILAALSFRTAGIPAGVLVFAILYRRLPSRLSSL